MNESFSYGRKVFLGGLPMAVTVAELHANFDRFGPLMVDWPHKASYEVMPPNRYAFLIFSNPASVNFLMSLCGPSDFNNFVIDLNNGNKVIISVKPWELRNNEAVLDRNWQRFERFSIFIGGVHRRATANELANLINEAIGGVVYVGMEIDEQTDYPKGAARVVFSNPASYIKAIGTRRITTMTNGYERVIELKPYVCDNMRCEECLVAEARFFCPQIRCLKYFCEMCWPMSHMQPGLGAHIPMDKNNLHLHTPKKHMQRVDKAYPSWIPLTPCSSLSSPLKLSPTLSDLKLDELKLFDALCPTSPSKVNMQLHTPKKFMSRGDKAFPGRIPLTPNSNMASPLKLIPSVFEFGPFKPEI